MVLLLVFMQLTRDLFAIAKFLFIFNTSGKGHKTQIESQAMHSKKIHNTPIGIIAIIVIDVSI